MVDGSIAQLATLSRGTRALADAALRADRRLQGQALAALPSSALPDLRLLTETHWHWLLEVVERRGRRVLVWRQRDVHPVLRIGLELSLKPVPKRRSEGPPRPLPVWLERPSLLLPPTSERLQRFAPGREVSVSNTVLLQLGEGDVLAVRRPDYLLGWVRAKLWWRGQRLRPVDGGWPAEPFLALARHVVAWRAGRGEIETVPLAGDPEDALTQVVAEIVRARHHLLETFHRASELEAQGEGVSHLGALLADPALVHLHADLALRIDTTGDLSDSEDTKTVFVRAHLDFGDGDASPPQNGRLRLDPPDFLASGEILDSLLDALEDDARRWWARGLGAVQMRRLLQDARAPQSGTFALRVGRDMRQERWVVFLSRPRTEALSCVVRADFRRGPVGENASRPRRLEAVTGGRRVEHRWDHVTGPETFDDDLIRSFLRLIAALHRYGQAVS